MGVIEDAINYVRYMVDTYGVASFFDNLDDEYTLEDAIDDRDIWYTCPHCDDMVLYDDYPEAFCHGCECPICEESFED